MKNTNMTRTWTVLALALGLTVFAACEQGRKSTIPTQPPARNFEDPETSIVVANFDCAKGGEDGLTIIFENKSTGEIDTYSWSFGDGTKGSAENPVHTYDEAGEYVVKLTVSNAISEDSLAKFCTAGTVAAVAPVGEEGDG